MHAILKDNSPENARFLSPSQVRIRMNNSVFTLIDLMLFKISLSRVVPNEAIAN